MPSQDKWDKTFLEMAMSISKMSKDPSTQVGAVLVSPDNQRISSGYNGFVKGINETPEKWLRPLKYQYVRHAEENAIVFCPFETKGATLYCTHQSCHRCMGLVAQAGIKRLVYVEPYKNLEYPDIWQEHASLLEEVKQMTL